MFVFTCVYCGNSKCKFLSLHFCHTLLNNNIYTAKVCRTPIIEILQQCLNVSHSLQSHKTYP